MHYSFDVYIYIYINIIVLFLLGQNLGGMIWGGVFWMQGMGWYWVVDRRMGYRCKDVAEVD